METQTKPAPPKVVVAPEGCVDHLTAGKSYNVIGIWDNWDDKYGYGFVIVNNIKTESCCLEIECPHLNGLNWIIKEREGSHE